MLTSKLIERCGCEFGPGETRVRLRPEGPPDTLFPISGALGHAALFLADCDAARRGEIKMVSVVKNGAFHVGYYAVPTQAHERARIAECNLSNLRAQMVSSYWNRFRRSRAAMLGFDARKTKRERHRLNELSATLEDRRPAALRALFPGAEYRALFRRLRLLEYAINIVEDERSAVS